MAVTFFPFNSIVVDGVPDRPANAENLAAYLAGFFSNGVLMQTDTALKVEASSGMNVQIHAGMGNINGKTILADAAEIITLDTASASLARIDRVVFRLDEVNRLMEFDVLKGTPASSPVAPALTQGADVYELCLAEIRVPAGATTILANYITDTRLDADLCGVASIAPHMQDLGHGGTGISAETEEDLLLALGGTNIKLAWRNSSPTSAFGAQTITPNQMGLTDLSPYDIALVAFRSYDTQTQHTPAVICEKDATTRHTYLWDHAYISLRSITFDDSGVYFGSAYYGKVLQSTAANNAYLIPTAIYIIKGVQ